ncbi:MAG: DUF4358 domain-containing protein [Clostridia bacterium]|nr:DUF4358 domain-containing protein [Clostridia bacterium]
MKTKLYALLRLLALAGLAATVVLGFAGKKYVTSDTPFETVLSAVTGSVDLSDVREGENQMVRRLYGVSPADYEECVLYYPSTNMGAEEILLVKLNPGQSADALVAAAEQRIKDQLNVFEGYGIEQVALLNDHARIEAPGNYFLFIVSAGADDAVAAFYEVL